MQFPSLAQLKKELELLPEKEKVNLISDLAKFSRENKAYLFFKLQEKENPGYFLEMIKEELDTEFQKSNASHVYYAKKSAQAIRRKLNKMLKLSKKKEDQIEAIMYFCEQLKEYGYLQFNYPVIDNLYKIQVEKVKKLILGLHEDLQYDFEMRLQDLE
ncbi:hypothetical protein [Algoriphagus hitonicola]|uniref:Uncharacterized protein n=1 Tax=Algoriphagus hitonicola TaxID=435880 RepID=A0A1I2RDH0_9BACT|nr:hypothetical protein [Algoriphagus hitonicola]SFG38532.1 hypothetical protein SAMN04487988_103196 [Algoriphagus hitonicola]